MNKKTIWVIVIVVILVILCICCLAAAFLLWQSETISDIFSGVTDTLNESFSATATPLSQSSAPEPATATPQPTREAIDPQQQTWLVMLYQDADDEVLEYDIFFDMNEAEYAGSSDRVHIVTQFDRYQGAFSGDGDWSGAKRFYLNTDPDLGDLTSQELADLGEVNMGDEAVLVDFVTWAINSYPADRYVLIMSDHGAGWYGGWTDSDNGDYDGIYLNELDVALAEILNRTGIGKFDLIGFDACLMAQLEAMSTLAPYTRYAVASEETEPSIGWAYAAFLSDLTGSPSMSPEQLARSIVDSYIAYDQRIVNEEARAEFVEDSFNYSGWTSVEEVAIEMGRDVTLSAFDLEALPQLHSALNQLVNQMQYVSQSSVAQARTYAQSYYNIFGPDVPASFIDLGHFARLLAEETGDAQISQAADELLSALDSLVVHEIHGPERPGSTGLSIYFPNSSLYVSSYGGYQIYTQSADRFARESQWDDFLAYHYSGQAIEPDINEPVSPQAGFELLQPGLGNINMGDLFASTQTVSVGESVHLETQINGDNIGYIYLFAGMYFPESSSYLATYADFILSDSTQQIDGVIYPDWGGSGSVGVAVDWTPYVFYISDGYDYEFAVLYPLYYGATSDQMVYAVDGTYNFAGGGQTYAIMTFGSDGWMREVYSYNREGGPEGPREISPQSGDSFTLLLKSIAAPDGLDSDPEFVEFDGGTLTFYDSNFFWESYLADPGEYVVGIGALDLDGNYTLDFVPVNIVE